MNNVSFINQTKVSKNTSWQQMENLFEIEGVNLGSNS
jgi:hypothetical protein